MKKESVAIYKKWWFWAIIGIMIIIALCFTNFKSIILEKDDKNNQAIINQNEGSVENNIIATNDANNKIEIDVTNLTQENYNKIKEGMKEKEVIEILGEGEKLSPEDAETYLMVWVDPNNTFCRIQIVFDKLTESVVLITGIGLY